MKKNSLLVTVLMLIFFVGNTSFAFAHFGMVIPSAQTVEEAANPNIKLTLMFWHPFENVGMELEKPLTFSVYSGEKSSDLTSLLKESSLQGKKVWELDYTFKKPGLNYFVMTPAPYWEEAEDAYIQHLTKVAVCAFGNEDGWEKPLGVKAEIVPLTKPYDLYTGNVFRGQVLQHGVPVPGAFVEIEFYPGKNLKGQAQTNTAITQTVVTDNSGIFTYAAPMEGWWGFAALMDDETMLDYKGIMKRVELGAVMWMYFKDMKRPVLMK